MSEQLQPTPFADVNVVLREFESGIRAILESQFVGMYLYGSLALGDFDPQSSDIDFIIVTAADISDTQFAALQNMHRDFAASESRWANKVEAAYIPQSALQHSTPTAAKYPQIESGRTLVKDPLEIGWAFQRHTLSEHSVIISGPHPRTLTDAVDPEALRRAGIAIAGGWLEQARHDPSWLEWVRQQGAQAFVVLTLCRLLYSLDTGDVTSKPAAGRWAQERVDQRWNRLIERSLAELHGTGETSASDVEETVAFIQYTVEQSER